MKKIGNFQKKNMIFYGFLCISSTISPSIHSISPKNRFKFTQLFYKFFFFAGVWLLLLAAGASPAPVYFISMKMMMRKYERKNQYIYCRYKNSSINHILLLEREEMAKK